VNFWRTARTRLTGQWPALYQRKDEWLKGCTERLNEARANLSAAEDLDIWSLLGT
jgi:hypothetical protein